MKANQVVITVHAESTILRNSPFLFTIYKNQPFMRPNNQVILHSGGHSSNFKTPTAAFAAAVKWLEETSGTS